LSRAFSGEDARLVPLDEDARVTKNALEVDVRARRERTQGV
jgi:hypothetical protein